MNKLAAACSVALKNLIKASGLTVDMIDGFQAAVERTFHRIPNRPDEVAKRFERFLEIVDGLLGYANEPASSGLSLKQAATLIDEARMLQSMINLSYEIHTARLPDDDDLDELAYEAEATVASIPSARAQTREAASEIASAVIELKRWKLADRRATRVTWTTAAEAEAAYRDAMKGLAKLRTIAAKEARSRPVFARVATR